MSGLQTFGFRGEALSSLCALSHFQILTAQANEAPKGKKLEFEQSGKLKSTHVAACQKGTIAIVEGLFESLPVRRKELTKNIKREYGKVIGLLHAYACISMGIKFTVKSSMPKGKSVTVFATRGNQTTRDNIANVYGAKTLSALLPLELELEFASNTAAQRHSDQDGDENNSNRIIVKGHISRPVFGEGRQTPDRQMFFVNSRPCGLPQIAKAINEVYKSFNVSQSPFIFANLVMNTNAYDVNVSPDKRTILLHDSANLIESLKSSLLELFENQDQTVPQSQLQNPKLPGFKQLTIQKQASATVSDAARSPDPEVTSNENRAGSLNDHTEPFEDDEPRPRDLFVDFLRDQVSTRPDPGEAFGPKPSHVSKAKEKIAVKLGRLPDEVITDDHEDTSNAQSSRNIKSPDSYVPEDDRTTRLDQSANTIYNMETRVRDFNARIAEEQNQKSPKDVEEEPEEGLEPINGDTAIVMPRHEPNRVQNAFDRMRPRRSAPETAEITIGDKTITTTIGSQSLPRSSLGSLEKKSATGLVTVSKSNQLFGKKLRGFAAPGTQAAHEDGEGPNSDTDNSEADDSEGQSSPSETSAASPSAHCRGDDTNVGNADLIDQEAACDDEGEGLARPKRRRIEVSLSPQGKTDTGSEASESEGVEHDESELDAEDEEYMDEEGKKAREEARVAELIQQAEAKSAVPSEDNVKRVAKIMKSGLHKDSTVHLRTVIDGTIDRLEDQLVFWNQRVAIALEKREKNRRPLILEEESPEERLSLTVSKEDFSRMRIVGQFNLGFVIAVRPSVEESSSRSEGRTKKRKADELFIIDQHASDEKFNFERLQLETVVGNQRLVRPKPLELTAVEEEIILENMPALEKNGFLVDIDTSGDEPIGRRCRLVSLPLSKEVVFDIEDLEELIHLLSESPVAATSVKSTSIPRPSKVRKMFAMRACRSSIMIGKTLTNKQMSTVVKHMGEMDKPWNCPHGRPTMRHLTSLDQIETWEEEDGLADEDVEEEKEKGLEAWVRFMNSI